MTPLRCPTQTCYGWVSAIEENIENLFYGCGSCGNVWFHAHDLFNEITAIIQKYPYRAAVYIHSEHQGMCGYVAVPLAEEPADYINQVNTEW